MVLNVLTVVLNVLTVVLNVLTVVLNDYPYIAYLVNIHLGGVLN